MYRKAKKIQLGEGLQERSKVWWNENPMTYDWRKTSAKPEGTREFFDEADARLFNVPPFFDGARTFAGLIPVDDLRGKRVLEVGCGQGSHAQVLAEAGGIVTAVDLTPRAVELTRQRFSQRGITADVRQMDAEEMDFADEQFDLVWSWGVIHHSASPERIARQVHRVLKPSGQFRVMVYHRRSLAALFNLARGALSGKFFRGMSRLEVESYYADGYVARFYTRSEFAALLRSAGFQTVVTRVLGATYELIPLPGAGQIGRLKRAIIARFPRALAKPVLSRCGALLFATATK